MRLQYDVIKSGRLFLMPTLSKLKQLEVVKDELGVLKNLELLEEEDSSLLIEN